MPTRQQQFILGRARDLDTYANDRGPGQIIGSRSPDGWQRLVTDVESLISITDGRLHLPTLTTRGWARQGVAYGPYGRANGLAFCVFLQDGDVQTTADGIPQHLAVGWFSSAAPASALTDGNALVFRENGSSAGAIERNGASQIAIIDTFKQLPAYALIVLRSIGAIYYVGSVTGANELPAYPAVRPLGIDTVKTDATVYASIWQRHIISMRTNVYESHVKLIDAWNQWYGTAIAADALTAGGGNVGGRAGEKGGSWTAQAQDFSVSATGAQQSPTTGTSQATIDPGAASGLVKVDITTGGSARDCAIIFRYQDSSNYWQFVATDSLVRLVKKVAGANTIYDQSGGFTLPASATTTLQVIDDGTIIHAYLGSTRITPTGGRSDSALGSATKCGFGSFASAAAAFKNFEAHPRTLTLPAEFQFGSPYMTTGATSVATENFTGAAADLSGKTTTTGALTWTKEAGSGAINLDGAGVGVVSTGAADVFYTLPWSVPAFADVAMDVTPDGTAYAQGKACRLGPLFWQDSNNWIAVRTFTDDTQVDSAEFEIEATISGSLAVLHRVNLGTALFPGLLMNVRASFNGDAVYVLLGTFAQQVFSLRDFNNTYGPLAIAKVGIYCGSADTGSKVDNFTARSA